MKPKPTGFVICLSSVAVLREGRERGWSLPFVVVFVLWILPPGNNWDRILRPTEPTISFQGPTVYCLLDEVRRRPESSCGPRTLPAAGSLSRASQSFCFPSCGQCKIPRLAGLSRRHAVLLGFVVSLMLGVPSNANLCSSDN